MENNDILKTSQTQLEQRSMTLSSKVINCPICGESMKARGLKGHIKWKHEEGIRLLNIDELKRQLLFVSMHALKDTTLRDSIVAMSERYYNPIRFAEEYDKIISKYLTTYQDANKKKINDLIDGYSARVTV